jgi:hypothetical protein
MLMILFSSAITCVLGALFLSSIGRGQKSHVIIIGCLAVASLAWLIASIASVPQ